MALIVFSLPSLAQDKKDTPKDKPAPLSIAKDEKIQEARKIYLKEEGDSKRAARFFDLAFLLGTAARKDPVPEAAVLRYLGKPDLVGYTGEKNAKDEWVKKTPSTPMSWTTRATGPLRRILQGRQSRYSLTSATAN
jgi:hypothetical protein